VNLFKQDEKLGRFTSSQYIYPTKDMTVLVEYGTQPGVCIWLLFLQTLS